jgi:hypothetical protein
VPTVTAAFETWLLVLELLEKLLDIRLLELELETIIVSELLLLLLFPLPPPHAERMHRIALRATEGAMCCCFFMGPPPKIKSPKIEWSYYTRCRELGGY